VREWYSPGPAHRGSGMALGEASKTAAPWFPLAGRHVSTRLLAFYPHCLNHPVHIDESSGASGQWLLGLTSTYYQSSPRSTGSPHVTPAPSHLDSLSWCLCEDLPCRRGSRVRLRIGSACGECRIVSLPDGRPLPRVPAADTPRLLVLFAGTSCRNIGPYLLSVGLGETVGQVLTLSQVGAEAGSGSNVRRCQPGPPIARCPCSPGTQSHDLSPVVHSLQRN
jgi:hypothetical protein